MVYRKMVCPDWYSGGGGLIPRRDGRPTSGLRNRVVVSLSKVYVQDTTLVFVKSGTGGRKEKVGRSTNESVKGTWILPVG